jgi:hypothetical protein
MFVAREAWYPVELRINYIIQVPADSDDEIVEGEKSVVFVRDYVIGSVAD